MKKLYLILLLMLPLLGAGQSITVTNGGSFAMARLDGTYTLDGTQNGKNRYTFSRSYEAMGCSDCWVSAAVYWDGTQWVQATTDRGGGGGGTCGYYCNYYSAGSVLKANATATALNPPCSGWPGEMTITGNCEGGALSDLTLSASNICQTQSLDLSWTNNVTLGEGNVFTVTLSNRWGSFYSETTVLGTLASTTASSLSVPIPTSVISSANYEIRLEASKAPDNAFALTTPKLTIGLPNSYPSVTEDTRYACSGQSVTFSTTSVYPSYQWFKGANELSGANGQSYEIPAVSYADGGSYAVSGVDAEGCRTGLSSDNSGLYLQVSEGPAIISYSISNIYTCEGNTTQFLNIETREEGAYTYIWKKGSETVKTETINSKTSSYAQEGGWQTDHAGSYTVTVSQGGCTSSTVSDEVTVQVDEALDPPTLPPEGTSAGPVLFTATPGFVYYRIYRWNGTDDYFHDQDSYSNTFTISTSGKYVVRGWNNCGETGNSNEVTVTTICDTPPALTTESAGLPATLTASAGFDYYHWYKWNGASYSGIAYWVSGTLQVTEPGQYAVKGYLGSCGESDFSDPITLVDPCAGETVAPTISSIPTTMTAACGAAASWEVTASDNCTASESITYQYYITGGSAIGGPADLQSGTGSGTVFTADAVVHVFAFDAAGNVSTESTIAITVSNAAYQFSAVSATSICTGGTSTVSVTLPSLPEGTEVDIHYHINGSESSPPTDTKTATVNASHIVTFEVENPAATSVLYINEIANHTNPDCKQTFTGANTVEIIVNECPEGDPIAWYQFNGDAKDAIGSLDGTVYGATLTSDRFGNANSAYVFDGIDDYIETAAVATDQTDNWAMTAWIKPANLSHDGAIVTNGFDDGWSGNGYALMMNNNQLNGLFSGIAWYYSDKYIANPEIWYHVAITRLNGETKVYLNGQPASTGSGTGPGTPSGTLRIGAQNGHRFFTGAIDDVKVYGHGLDDEQVGTEYESSLINPLPVKLISFTAQKQENAVNLSWQTTEETNSDHFEVQHSPDGKKWDAVGSVVAAVESRSATLYHYLHARPLNGINYYRLKMVDRDGSFAYSGIAAVAWESIFKQLVYPNPVAGDYIMVSYRGRRPELSLTDMTGRAIGFKVVETGSGVLRIDPATRLPSGMYILRATDGKEQVIHKVIVAE